MPLHLTPEYLHQEYTVKGRSDRDIANEHSTYPNAVRRLRLKFGIPSRDKAEAQELALKSGRHQHPTKGRERDEDSRRNISEGVAEAWERKDEWMRAAHSVRAKKQWSQMTPEEVEIMRRAAVLAVRDAANKGSKLEQFLLKVFVERGEEIEFHVYEMVGAKDMRIDISLPKRRVAINVDGPSHFKPIWGQEKFEERQRLDQENHNLILKAGFRLIRVKSLARSVSDKKKRMLLDCVLAAVENTGSALVVEIEVK